ncbi:NAD(P)-binding protein [Gymnopus androsaceus JB14]|uniref:NAD(P)-binding protein n=1 Tax=Gymnopus androsaceus JB14 TaxID=1447944 RepID=A0A6A4HMU9_9AGAR|nr:NAD(P)-binding protein [Gymnopus androsaceus JB14]
MKVLVLGASGFIGFPAAQALVRAGHFVYGLTRSQEKAKILAGEEIIPIVGEIGNPDAWVDIVKDLDVVIDAVGGTADVKQLSHTTLAAVSAKAKASRPDHAPKLTYIYTSGTWVHGDNRNDVVTDSTPLRGPPELVSWRPAQEQRTIHDPVLNGIVIRPALLYGRGGSLLAPLFKGASEGRVAWPGTPGGRYALIHTDDLADMYVRACEKAPIVGGVIFDACNEFTESADDVLAALVKVSGAKGQYEYTKPSNLYEVALSTTSLIRPYLARTLLGWQPSKPGLVDGLPMYYAAWKALQ